MNGVAAAILLIDHHNAESVDRCRLFVGGEEDILGGGEPSGNATRYFIRSLMVPVSSD